MAAPAKCKLDKGRFLKPCQGLKETANAQPATQAKGVRLVTLSTFGTWKKVRTIAMLHSGEYAKDGVLMNFCPFCGVEIGDAYYAEAPV